MNNSIDAINKPKPTSKVIIIIALLVVSMSILASVAYLLFSGGESATESVTTPAPSITVYDDNGNVNPDASGFVVEDPGYSESESEYSEPEDEPLLPEEPECRVFLYGKEGFRNELAILTNKPNSKHAQIDEDGLTGISSIRIEGDLGCKVQIFESNDHDSNMLNYTIKASDQYPFVGELKKTGPRQIDLNDKVKSIKIWADPLTETDEIRKDKDDAFCEVTLFKDKWFRSPHLFQFNTLPGQKHDLGNEDIGDDNTDAVYLRGKNCKMDLWGKHGFNNDGKTASFQVSSGKNEAYADLQGGMVYEGSAWAGDVKENKLGSFKVKKI